MVGIEAAAVVGREAELALVAAELERRAAGAVLLEGEAGIGKTTVLEAAVRLGQAAGRTLLACRGSGAETQLTFAALGDLLEPLADEVLGALPPPQRRALEAVLLLDDTGEEAGVDVRAVGLALLNVLRVMAREGPCLVAIDDLQWLDAASAAVLEFALRRLPDEPLLVLATVRAGEPSLDLPRLLPTRRVPIGPLSLGALHHVVAAELGSPLPRRPLRRVHEISGGNPFYALELVRAGFGLESAELPPSLDRVVRGRLEALPRRTRRVLFDVAALAEPTAALVDGAALEPALAGRLVAFDGETLRFTHPLLAAAAYATLSPPRRRAAHARLAEIAPTQEERARHLALAADGPGEDVAAALVEAASAASQRGGPAAAAELLEHAVRTTPDGQVRARRVLLAADAHLAAGEWGRARTLLRELHRTAAQPLAAEAAVRLATWVLEDVRSGIDLCTAALDQVADEPALRARLRAALCANLHLVGDYRGALEQASEAVADAERAADRQALAVALGYLGMVEVILASDQAGAHLERARELVEGDERLLPVRPGTWFGLRHMYRYELAAARDLLQAECDAAVETGDDAQRSGVLLHLCELEWRAGDWQAALAYAREGYSLAEQVGDLQGRGALLYALALVNGHLGRVEEARAATADGLRLAAEVEDRVFPALHALAAGLLDFSLERHEQALAQFALLDDLFGAQELEPAIVPYQGDAIEALVALGRVDEAAQRVERLERQATRLGRTVVLADAARGKAAGLAARGRLDEAVAALERALCLLAPVDAPYPRARLLLAYGIVLRRAKRRAAARAALEDAAAEFEQLGAAIWLERTRRELGRISGRRRESGALTETERRIAELVASGRSNKEVAAALFVTVRTVESNLTRIYGKLGLRSRTELAHRYRE